MASRWKPFTFYDTFNDTFDSNRGHRKISVPESRIINFTVLQAPEIDLDQHEDHVVVECEGEFDNWGIMDDQG